jgi:hypothetical protein
LKPDGLRRSSWIKDSDATDPDAPILSRSGVGARVELAVRSGQAGKPLLDSAPELDEVLV